MPRRSAARRSGRNLHGVLATRLGCVHGDIRGVQEAVRVAGVVGEDRHADARGHRRDVDVRSLQARASGDFRAQRFADAQRRRGIGLGQDDDELVATETRREVTGTQQAGHALADVGDGLAADEVSVAVDDLLEVVEVEHDHRQRRAALDELRQDAIQVTRVAHPGQVVGERGFARPPIEGGVVDGDGGIVGEHLHEAKLTLVEGLEIKAVHHLDDSQQSVVADQRHTDHAVRPKAGARLDRPIVALVGAGVVETQRAPVTRHPSGDSLVDADPHAVDDPGLEATRCGKHQAPPVSVEEQQRRGLTRHGDVDAVEQRRDRFAVATQLLRLDVRTQLRHDLLDGAQIRLVEGLSVVAVGDLDDPEHRAFALHRHRQQVLALAGRQRLVRAAAALIARRVVDDGAGGVARHPGRHAAAGVVAVPLEAALAQRFRGGEDQFLALRVVEHQRGRGGVGQHLHALHDDAQDLRQLERRGQRLDHVVQDIEVFRYARHACPS
jgi:hypothetical protein